MANIIERFRRTGCAYRQEAPRRELSYKPIPKEVKKKLIFTYYGSFNPNSPARMTYAELAKKFNVPETTASGIVNLYRKYGIIRGEKRGPARRNFSGDPA